MRRSVVRTATVAVAAMALTLTGFGPASAGRLVIKEKGDVHNPLDIWTFKATYSKSALTATVKVRNLKRDKKQQVFLIIDPRPLHGFGYALRIDLNKRVRARLYKAKRRNPDHLIRVRCKVPVQPKYKRDRITFKIRRSCLRKPKKVRVSLLTARRDRKGTADEAPDNTQWSRWIKRG